MSPGMARKGINRQQDHVYEHDQRADAHVDTVRKFEGDDCVVPETHNEEDSYVEEISVDVLQDERKLALAGIMFAPLAYRARWRIEEVRTIVGLAVVVAGKPEAEWPAHDQYRRGKRPPVVLWIDQRGIKRR